MEPVKSPIVPLNQEITLSQSALLRNTFQVSVYYTEVPPTLPSNVLGQIKFFFNRPPMCFISVHSEMSMNLIMFIRYC